MIIMVDLMIMINLCFLSLSLGTLDVNTSLVVENQTGPDQWPVSIHHDSLDHDNDGLTATWSWWSWWWPVLTLMEWGEGVVTNSMTATVGKTVSPVYLEGWLYSRECLAKKMLISWSWWSWWSWLFWWSWWWSEFTYRAVDSGGVHSEQTCQRLRWEECSLFRSICHQNVQNRLCSPTKLFSPSLVILITSSTEMLLHMSRYWCECESRSCRS